MRIFWSTTIATSLLLGFTGVTMAAAVGEDWAQARADGHAAIVMAEYTLACSLRR